MKYVFCHKIENLKQTFFLKIKNKNYTLVSISNQISIYKAYNLVEVKISEIKGYFPALCHKVKQTPPMEEKTVGGEDIAKPFCHFSPQGCQGWGHKPTSFSSGVPYDFR